MGTFTVSYLVKTVFNQHKYKIPFVILTGYVGYCYEKSGEYKASMMKGQSRMYAHLREGLPKDADIWRY
ncbi:unnamed protein product [Bursaphelenchus xylophilus]|nr:unnamed protein product [Bursaphelenchus xylophilus]CAG9121885.1 unnamed protein product [Bursaphelenchus xylophilus]